MDKYNLPMRVIHWLMSVTIIGLLAIGIYMTGLEDANPQKWDFYALHKSFGMVVMILIFTRIFIRLFSKTPALPQKISNFEQKLASLGVLLLYIGMLALPLSGYIMSVTAGYGVVAFGIAVPDLLSFKCAKLSNIMHEAHVTGAYIFIAIIVFHILGMLKHIIIDKVNLLKRIV